jgi:hypothetical protein
LSDVTIDERGFNALRQIKAERGGTMTLGEFKRIVREQFLMLLLDEQRALATLPGMLGPDPAQRRRTIEALRRVASAADGHDRAHQERLATIEQLFGQERGEKKVRSRRASVKKDDGRRVRPAASRRRRGQGVAAAAPRRWEGAAALPPTGARRSERQVSEAFAIGSVRAHSLIRL